MLLPPLLYTQILDPINVVVALAIGSFALLVCTVCDGLDSVSADTRQSAAALGYKPAQQFFQNDPPLAVPVIRYGLCVAVVFKVRIVSVAALIGTPQLGSLFTLGLPAAISDSHHRWDRGQHHSGAAAGYAGGLRHSSTQQLATSERIIMLQNSLSIRCIPQIRGAPTALAVDCPVEHRFPAPLRLNNQYASQRAAGLSYLAGFGVLRDDDPTLRRRCAGGR